MDYLIQLLIILFFLILPYFMARAFFWLQTLWIPKLKPRRFVVFIGSYLLWFSVLGWLMSLLYKTIDTKMNCCGDEYNMKYDIEKKIPKFPWPPPAASSFMTIPLLSHIKFTDNYKYTRDYDNYSRYKDLQNLETTKAPLLLHANTFLRNALDSTGHFESSYYSVPGGFALVTRLEKIKKDGTPVSLPLRWKQKANVATDFSFENYLRALFKAPPGYYRLIVFVVSPYSFAQSSEITSRDFAESWLRYGENILPYDLAMKPYTKHFVCTALIYEFENYDTKEESVFRQPGRLDARTHIIKSGIWRYLM